MTLEDAIKHAKEVAKEKRKEYERACALNVPSEGFCECAAEHEQLAEWLTELQERREADRWVSVKDKLPEEYGNYLVFTDDGDIDIGVYHPRYIVPQWSMCDADGFYWADDKDIKVLAWKPLPKAYEPKGGAEC